MQSVRGNLERNQENKEKKVSELMARYNALMKENKFREARGIAMQAKELDPDNAIYLCELGRILLAAGDREGAAEAVARAAELVPDDAEVRKAAGEVGLSIG